MVLLYERNKCIICQNQFKETIFKVSTDSMDQQMKNIYFSCLSYFLIENPGITEISDIFLNGAF